MTLFVEMFKVTGNYNYLWSTGDTTLAIKVAPNLSTTYFVTVFDSIESCFDSILVAVTNLMSLLVAKIQHTINDASLLNSNPITEVDEKTRAIIEAAIKMHTKR